MRNVHFSPRRLKFFAATDTRGAVLRVALNDSIA